MGLAPAARAQLPRTRLAAGDAGAALAAADERAAASARVRAQCAGAIARGDDGGAGMTSTATAPPSTTNASTATAAPRVSVLMPAYNARRYLAEAIGSILAQTFGDFELVVVDDGSTDDTLKILNDYAARDPRVRVVSRANTGISGALNDGLK